MNVTLYGAASDAIDRIYIDRVEELGYELAKAGHTMVFGGGSSGLMGSAKICYSHARRSTHPECLFCRPW